MGDLLQLVGDGEDPRRKHTPAGLEDPSFRVGEPGEVPGGPLIQGLLQGVEPRFDPGGGESQGRGPPFGGTGLGAPGIPDEGFPGGRVGSQAIGPEKRLRLAGGEGVTGSCIGQSHLEPALKSAELRGHRHRQASRVEPEAELRRQAVGEDQSALDPGLLPAEELRDRRRGELVVFGERGHDPGLVHGTRGLPGGVGREDPGLHGDAGDRLHDHGDLLPAFALPDDHALESVDDLEAAVRSPGHPDRHGSQVGPSIGVLPAQRSE